MQSRSKEEEALNKGLFASFLVLQGIKAALKNQNKLRTTLVGV
jgi:hypothetical protein